MHPAPVPTACPTLAPTPPHPRAARAPLPRLAPLARLAPAALVALIVLLPASAPARAAEARGAIAGTVTHAGQPLEGALVRLGDEGTATRTDAAGAFAFADVPAGRHVLRADRLGYQTAARRVEVVAGTTASVTLALEPFHHEETVIISATSGARASSELAQAVSELSGADLLAEAQPTLGQTLDALPGVSSTYFGPAASRPIIRGLGGDRVRIMTNGLDVGDASSASPDHAVAAEPVGVDRIEVVRGPATLRWGSAAIGGVVNVLDSRLPAESPREPITGVVQLLSGTNADERAASAALDGGGERFAWHADGFGRAAGDLEIPGGRLENSSSESSGGAAGLGVFGRRGRLAVSAGLLDARYGSPADEEVAIRLDQRRHDADGEWRWADRFVRKLSVRAGTSDYEHVEMEDGAVGTRFLNDSDEIRVEAHHARAGRLEGSWGVQGSWRDFAAIGDEAFVPPTRTRTVGVFGFEEIVLRDPWRLQAGARFEEREVRARGDAPGSRTASGLSASVGVVRAAEEGFGFAFNLARSVKLPAAEELYSNGPHLATGAFEIGDDTLDPEVGAGAEASVRWRRKGSSAHLTGFLQRFDGFIREAPTGEIEDDLPVFRFVQEDARLHGFELGAEFSLLDHPSHHIRLQFSGEVVRARTADGEPLPRIPADSAAITIRHDGPAFWGLLRLTVTGAQDRVAPFETETPGWERLDGQVGWRRVQGAVAHDIILRAGNLTDRTARQHASFLKDVAPLPGRGLSLAYRIVF